jgi:hypothetical protein
VIRAFCLFGVLVLGTAGAAHAYSINLTDSGFIVRWQSLPVAFHLNMTGSDNIGNGSDITAIENSLTDWEAVSCSKLDFEIAGTTSTTNVLATGAAPNGQNEITWVEDSSWTFGEFVLGVTVPLSYTTGMIVEADIAFNGLQVKWSTTGQFGRADVKSVAIHEIGHAFGLQHNLAPNQNNPPTMAPTADPYGKTASLEADDREGACFLYPGNAKHACSGDYACPYVVSTNAQTGQEYYTQKLLCNATATCEFSSSTPETKKGLGEACATQDECVSPNFCQPLQGGEAYCAKVCTPNGNDCPSGFDCIPYQSGVDGACIPSAGGPTLGEGEYCSSNEECQSNLCYPSMNGTWQCRQSCADTTQCPGGYECFISPGYPTGGCLPSELIPSFKVQSGDPCNSNVDCETGICVITPGTAGPQFCRDSCLVSLAQCGDGFVCAPIGPTGGACVPDNGTAPQPPPAELLADGSPCTSGTQCQSQNCFAAVCGSPCNVLSPSCSAEQACQRLTPDGTAGVCRARGPTAVGEVCTGDPDCNALFCERISGGNTSICLTPCAVGAVGCGPSQTCEALPNVFQIGACFVSAGPTGQPATPSEGGASESDSNSGSGGGMCSVSLDGGAVPPTAAFLVFAALLLLAGWRRVL